MICNYNSFSMIAMNTCICRQGNSPWVVVWIFELETCHLPTLTSPRIPFSARVLMEQRAHFQTCITRCSQEFVGGVFFENVNQTYSTRGPRVTSFDHRGVIPRCWNHLGGRCRDNVGRAFLHPVEDFN